MKKQSRLQMKDREGDEVSNVILEASGLCKTFQNGQVATNVVRNLDLQIYEHEFTVIMGSSGAGKSTLLYVLSGIDQATSGEVHLCGKRIDHLKEKAMTNIRRKDIGFIFQEPNLLEDFSVFENVAVTGYMGSKNRQEVNARAEALLRQVDMQEHLNKYPSQLSGGQKQRVAIARSLINQPKILFADEPTGALNAAQGENVLELLTTVKDNGQTILMVTHDLKAAAYADRLLFIKDGKIGGELKLTNFEVDMKEEREQQIFDFLMDRGW